MVDLQVALDLGQRLAGVLLFWQVQHFEDPLCRHGHIGGLAQLVRDVPHRVEHPLGEQRERGQRAGGQRRALGHAHRGHHRVGAQQHPGHGHHAGGHVEEEARPELMAVDDLESAEEDQQCQGDVDGEAEVRREPQPLRRQPVVDDGVLGGPPLQVGHDAVFLAEGADVGEPVDALVQVTDHAVPPLALAPRVGLEIPGPAQGDEHHDRDDDERRQGHAGTEREQEHREGDEPDDALHELHAGLGEESAEPLGLEQDPGDPGPAGLGDMTRQLDVVQPRDEVVPEGHGDPLVDADHRDVVGDADDVVQHGEDDQVDRRSRDGLHVAGDDVTHTDHDGVHLRDRQNGAEDGDQGRHREPAHVGAQVGEEPPDRPA